jgi:hypothetical protein
MSTGNVSFPLWGKAGMGACAPTHHPAASLATTLPSLQRGGGKP